MSEPETAAGRRLLSILGGTADADYQSPITNAILAIEAEARAALLSELRAAVEGLRVTRSVPLKALPTGPKDWDDLVSRAAVLALLESLPVPEPLPQGEAEDGR